MLRGVALVGADVSAESIAFVVKVTKIVELGTLTVTAECFGR
jgi:hypothetical protein